VRAATFKKKIIGGKNISPPAGGLAQGLCLPGGLNSEEDDCSLSPGHINGHRACIVFIVSRSPAPLTLSSLKSLLTDDTVVTTPLTRAKHVRRAMRRERKEGEGERAARCAPRRSR